MNKKFKNLIIAPLFLVGLFLFSAPVVRAANLQDAFQGQLSTVGSRGGFDTSKRDVNPIIGTLISVILSFLGVIFLILMVYGGYMWMTAAGNEEKAKKARALIQAAVLGLIVVVGAYAMTIFVMSRIAKDLIPESGGVSSGSYDATSTSSGSSSSTSTSGGGNSTVGCCKVVLISSTECYSLTEATCTESYGDGASFVAGTCNQVAGCPGYKDDTIGASGCCYTSGTPGACATVDNLDYCEGTFFEGKNCSEASDCLLGCCIVDNDIPAPPTCHDRITQETCSGSYGSGSDFRLLWSCSDIAECN